MTDLLSDDDLNRLEALAEGATPGPWEADVNEVSQHWTRPEPWLPVVSTEVSCMAYCYGGTARGIENKADAEFIAAARNALPALLAEVREHRLVQGSVEHFIEDRIEYIQALYNSPEMDADYYRWSGGAEARRQLAQSLGWTVPYDPGDKARKDKTDD